jgi:hypothetical protein
MKSTVDQITLIVWLSMWPVFLIWEIILLLMRGAGWAEMPALISMVAREYGWSLSAVVYVWFGLGAHFWWNASARYPGVWDTITALSFWLICVALLVWDIVLWRSDFTAWPTALRWARWPVAWMVAGALSGRFLFPQVGRVPWN